MLPIYDIELELVNALKHHSRVTLSAPTGSGKSTQVPQMVRDRQIVGDQEIIILQPRRLAARLLAKRVAEERKVRLGGEVGFHVRLDHCSSRDTRITYVTEGILLRRFLSDPTLKNVGAILFDEFHERHVHGDITLAKAMQLQAGPRPDLKLVVMSATLDTSLLRDYLEPCEHLACEGRTFPVELDYLPRSPGKTEVWDLAAGQVNDALRRGHAGDVLVFMPGAYEIRRTIEAIRKQPAAKGCVVLPLHGELPPAEQDAAVGHATQRKIIVSTNVAETSLTIDGVRMVIDSGLARVARFDPYRGINTLMVEKISQASAEQRAGRAGRTANGTCIRLWTASEHKQRPLHDKPEIKRVDLSETLLTLKADGLGDPADFPWLEAPDDVALNRAIQFLTDLGAIDPSHGAITELGRRILAFPMHPRYGRMLLAGQEQGCVREVALIAALTQGRPILLRNQGKPVQVQREKQIYHDGDASDFFPLMRAWHFAHQNKYRVGPCRELGIHAQAASQATPLLNRFLNLAEAEGLTVGDMPAPQDAVQKAILVGFIDQLAKRADRGTTRCHVIHKRKGKLARETVIRDAKFVVAAEVHEIERRKGEVQVELSQVTAVDPLWLHEMYPHAVREEDGVDFDADGKRVVGRHRVMFQDLALQERTLPDPPVDAAAELLAREVMSGTFRLKKWTEAVEQWIHRLNGVARWAPELQLPSITDEDRAFLVQQICHGSFSYKQIKDKDVWPTLRSWLHQGQQELIDLYAPERLQLPCGRRARITYSEDGPPTVSARVQDLYDIEGHLTIAQGKVPLRIEILAPNQRPVQITDDLTSFWKNTYPQVKKDLAGRYPKHEWR